MGARPTGATPPAGEVLRVAVLVLSDRGFRGEREDLSGPALADWLGRRRAQVVRCDLLPDDSDGIAQTLREWADADLCDLVVTCGGTGVAPRDVTPEATRAVVDRTLPGFGEVMRRRGLEHTPHAIVSRALAGVCNRTLIVNLPGSPRAALESLEAVWPAVGHTVAKIRGDESDCARPDGPR